MNEVDEQAATWDRNAVLIVAVVGVVGVTLDIIGLAVWWRLGELITLMTAGR